MAINDELIGAVDVACKKTSIQKRTSYQPRLTVSYALVKLFSCLLPPLLCTNWRMFCVRVVVHPIFCGILVLGIKHVFRFLGIELWLLCPPLWMQT